MYYEWAYKRTDLIVSWDRPAWVWSFATPHGFTALWMYEDADGVPHEGGEQHAPSRAAAVEKAIADFRLTFPAALVHSF